MITMICAEFNNDDGNFCAEVNSDDHDADGGSSCIIISMMHMICYFTLALNSGPIFGTLNLFAGHTILCLDV